MFVKVNNDIDHCFQTKEGLQNNWYVRNIPTTRAVMEPKYDFYFFREANRTNFFKV